MRVTLSNPIMKRKLNILQRTGFAGMLLLLLSVIFMLTGFSPFSQQHAKPQQSRAAKTSVVVMELFTSQGCSSCPPADALLAAYAKPGNEQIIPLSFHVDYWNRLGWSDPFSSSRYSDRQQWYSGHLPGGRVYTPQLVVNGRYETVGNNRAAVTKLVTEATGNTVMGRIEVKDIAIGKNSIRFHYVSSHIGEDAVLNIALVQKEAITHIRAGENEGVTLTNRNIVRSFVTQSFSREGDGLITLPPVFEAAAYTLVLYVQDKNTLAIKAAVKTELDRN